MPVKDGAEGTATGHSKRSFHSTHTPCTCSHTHYAHATCRAFAVRHWGTPSVLGATTDSTYTRTQCNATSVSLETVQLLRALASTLPFPCRYLFFASQGTGAAGNPVPSTAAPSHKFCLRFPAGGISQTGSFPLSLSPHPITQQMTSWGSDELTAVRSVQLLLIRLH